MSTSKIRRDLAHRLRTKEVNPTKRSWPYTVLVPHRDDKKEIYYRPTRDPKQAKSSNHSFNDFFCIPNLVLDLDDETNRNVRPVTIADEPQFAAKWNTAPNRQRAQSQADELRQVIDSFRHKIGNTTTSPVNAWSITHHDKFSVALRGAPVAASGPFQEAKSGNGKTRSKPNSATSQYNKVPGLGCPVWQALDPRKQNAIRTVAGENGIYEGVLSSHQLLLDWMNLRQQPIEQATLKELTNDPSTIERFVGALVAQDSIAGIRRLVSRALGIWPELLSTNPDSGSDSLNFSSEIRQACMNVLGKDNSNVEAVIEILAMLGNMKIRLGDSGHVFGPSLWGLGLVMSAKASMPMLTSEYLRLGFLHHIWDQYPDMASDLVLVLEAYLDRLGSLSGDEPMKSQDRQNLFAILLGINQQGLHGQSIRTCLLKALNDGHESQITLAYRAYECYIMLLGRIGAIRTLWQEWRDTAYYVQERMKAIRDDKGVRFNIIAPFTNAFKSSVAVAGPLFQDMNDDVSDFVQCVWNDHKHIKNQDPRRWIAQHDRQEALVDEKDYVLVGEALNRPLSRLLETVRTYS